MLKVKSIAIEIICSLLILLFVYAAVSKWLDFEKFRAQLGQSPLLSWIAGVVAWLIPFLELIISIILLFSAYRYLALFISFSLMCIFTFYIIVIMNFSDYVPCSCGGILKNMNWTTHLIFNCCVSVLIMIGILIYPSRKLAEIHRT
jgi:uncharacterized membrane protein YphA (DoxX/SURF4 family)